MPVIGPDRFVSVIARCKRRRNCRGLDSNRWDCCLPPDRHPPVEHRRVAACHQVAACRRAAESLRGEEGQLGAEGCRHRPSRCRAPDPWVCRNGSRYHLAAASASETRTKTVASGRLPALAPARRPEPKAQRKQIAICASELSHKIRTALLRGRCVDIRRAHLVPSHHGPHPLLRRAVMGLTVEIEVAFRE